MKKAALILIITLVITASFGLSYAFQSAHSGMVVDELISCTERSSQTIPFSCFTHCLFSATTTSQLDKVIPMTSLIFFLALLMVAGIFVFTKSKWLPVYGNSGLYFQPLYLFKTVFLKE